MNYVETICQESDKLLSILHQAFDVEPSQEVLQDILFNWGWETKKSILEPRREMFRALGEENESIWFDTIGAQVGLLNTIMSAFAEIPFEVAFLMRIENEKTKVIML